MSNNFKYVQTQPFTLGAGGANIGDITLILSSFLDINGVPLAMTDFGTIGFGTLEPSSGINEEQICFTGITQNGNGTATLTGVKTVLFKSPYTQTSGLGKAHAGGVTFVISNTAGFYNELVSVDDDETINGLYTFTQFPISPTAAPITNYQFANKKYVDDTTISGAPNATTSVQGLVQLPTQAQVDAKTGSGSTGAALSITPDLMRATQYNDYVVDTGSASTYVIAPSPAIGAYATGQQFTFIAATANSASSGASTIAVSGLATKSIKKLHNTALAVNDILAGQVVSVVFDGTNFQLMEPVGNAPQLLASISTTTTLGTSDTLYPSQNAVKTYVDTSLIKTMASTIFETSARFTSIANSGTNTFATNGVSMDTTGTTTRNAGITWLLFTGGTQDIFANNPIFSTSIDIETKGTTGSSFFGIGTVTAAGSGHTYTTKHAGFKILIVASTASLYATQADGSTETASSALTTVTTNDILNLVCRVNGSASVDYYWSKNGGAWSSATNLATHVPTADTTGKCQFSLANDSTATDNIISVGAASYQR